MLSVASHLPSGLINGFDSVIRFVNGTVLPTVQFSGLISNAVSAPFRSSPRDSNDNDQTEDSEAHQHCQQKPR